MTKINKTNQQGLTREKKMILKASKGKAPCRLDLNKVMEEWKYAKN